MTSTPPTPSDWRQRVEQELGPGRDFERALVTRTLEGLSVAPLYTEEDRRGESAATRRTGDWAITQGTEHPDPRTANRRLLDELQQGATGAFIELGAEARGIPSDPRCDVPGARVRWLHDMEALLDGVYLDAVPIAFGTNANGVPLGSTFLALAEERKLDAATLEVHLGMDPIASFARDGVLPGDMVDARRELCLLAGHSRMHLDRARSLAVDAGVWHRAGAHAVQELGFAAAGFIEMLRWLEEDGLPPSAAHSEFVWRMDLGRDVFTEIAKLRAARAMHARIMGAAGVDVATPLKLHVTTSARNLATRDPWSNMLRATLGTFAGAAGGADLITVLPFDAALGDPSPLGRRNARNTQLVLAAESRLEHVGDPARGSYFIEARTDELARAAWKLMGEIERDGGMTAALNSGRIADELGASRDALTDQLSRRVRPVVGVSVFPAPEDQPSSDAAPAEAGGDAEHVARVKARGDLVLGSVDSLAHGVRAASSGATLDEIGGALVRGARATMAPMMLMREASVFEDLADAADRMDRRPTVFLAALGRPAEHGARATFASQLFSAGGVGVETGTGADSAEDLAAAFTASGAQFACIVGTDDAYDEHAEATAGALAGAGARRVLLARKAKDGDDALLAAGLSGHIFAGCDARAVLADLLESEGAVLAAMEVNA